jgi:MFS family permease
VFAVYGAVAGLAVAAGLLLGGILTEADVLGLGWRAIFLVNVPVALVVLVAGAAIIPETRDRSAPAPDLAGTTLLTVGLLAIVYVLLEGRGLGWPAPIWGLAGLGLGALALLAVVEGRRRHTGASLPTALFRIPAFSAGNLIQLLFSASMAGFFFVLTIWLQGGEGFSPLSAGLTALAFSAGTIVFAGMPQRLIPRFGRRVLVAGGLLMAVGTIVAMVAAAAGGSPIDGWSLVPGLFVAGTGLALLVIPLANVVMSVVPVASAGGAAGVLSTAQQLGGAIGIVVMGEVFFAALPTSGFRDAFITAAPAAVAGFAICALLAIALPDTAVEETYG